MPPPPPRGRRVRGLLTLAVCCLEATGAAAGYVSFGRLPIDRSLLGLARPHPRLRSARPRRAQPRRAARDAPQDRGRGTHAPRRWGKAI
ncbi:MAG: hypothetical protein J3K34DRAFT_419484 [Monoraphidium minutum]|nr:MAG: hypothetical protein J3K34DRAFT_419484 [Monoraphidium minutum]